MPYTKNPAPCGTYQAYDRHRYRNEEPCDACRRAWADYMRKLRHSNGDNRPYRPPRHGTYSGAQAHRVNGEKPCEACRQARNEYMREWRAGRSVSSRNDRATMPETIIDVLETRGSPLPSAVIADLVIELHPEWRWVSVRQALTRMDEVELVDRNGEFLWRLTT